MNFTSTNRLSLRKIEVYISSQVYIKGSLGGRIDDEESGEDSDVEKLYELDNSEKDD